MTPNRCRSCGLLAVSLVCLAGCSISIDAGEVNGQAAARESSVGAAADAETLVGRWQVDLRPTPGSEPLYQEFVVDSVEGKTFTGTFYGSPISEARLNTDWGAVHFSFISMDGSGAYLHAGVLRDGRLEGTSNSTGRDFLSVWSGERSQ
ncbi:MAG: hypothetical protein HRU13_08165 [Phycisphaerales bacterium]|nr:hypothetical protein [Phycisphaerales bacterium]